MPQALSHHESMCPLSDEAVKGSRDENKSVSVSVLVLVCWTRREMDLEVCGSKCTAVQRDVVPATQQGSREVSSQVQNVP